MLTIRLARVGKKNKAQFKIVLQEATVAPGGRHVAVLGSYDPHQKVAVIKDDKVKYWLSKGAKISDTVHNIFVSRGIISGPKRSIKVPKKAAEEVPAGTAEKETSNEVKEEIKKEKTEETKEEAKTENIKAE